jgi:hypothetical protein
MVITAPNKSSSQDASTHLKLNGASTTQALYAGFRETPVRNIVQRKRGDYSFVYVAIALLAIGIALAAGSGHFDQAAWGDPSTIGILAP